MADTASGRTKVKTTRRLTPRQQAFLSNYVADPDQNATRAVMRAGYKTRWPGILAVQILGSASIRAALAAERERLAKKFRVEPERVMTELAKVGFSDLRDVMSWGPDGAAVKPSGELSDEAAGAVETVEQVEDRGGNKRLKIKLHDKLEALNSLSRIMGMDKSGGGVTVNINARQMSEALEGLKRLNFEPAGGLIDLSKVAGEEVAGPDGGDAGTDER
jgi:phage terminase small subunit